MCVALLLTRLDFLCVNCVGFSGFALVSSNLTLVLLCTMVRLKRRVGTVLFLSRVAKDCRPTVGCVAGVEVTRLQRYKSCRLEEKKQLEGLV